MILILSSVFCRRPSSLPHAVDCSTLLRLPSDQTIANPAEAGATRIYIIRQFAVENATLVLSGAIAGILLASIGVRLLMRLAPQPMRDRMPFLNAVSLNQDVLLFAAVVAMVSLIVYTLAPALRVSWRALQHAITEGNASAGSGSLSWRRVGSILVIAEVAVSVLLIFDAGLFSRSLKNLLHIELHFKSDSLVTLPLDLPSKKLHDDSQRVAMERRVIDRLAAIPGVESAGYSDLLPVYFNGNTDWIRFPSRPYDGKHIEINARSASPTYFKTLQVPLLRDRFFNEQDTADKPLVAIVNTRFGESYFPGQEPIGKTFGNTALDPKSLKTIVGVVDDLHEGALDDPIWPAAYYSAYQAENGMAIVLRITGSDSPITSSIPSIVHALNPDLADSDVMTMNDRMSNSQSATLRRGAAWLAGTFAATALLLCAVGLYGVISYSVSLRTREIGLHMALVAHRRSIYPTVLREASRLSLTGIVAGILLSTLSMSMLQAILFQVKSWDIPTLAGSCLLLICCSIAASLAPARRAALANPTEALRSEERLLQQRYVLARVCCLITMR